MVFDYFGENVSQFEIADVARTVPYVTYTDELRRAAHFSDLSTSMGSEMPENITGYTARKLGYAALEMPSMTLDDLKTLIDMNFPIILLMRWVPGEPYGHYRVAVGYNATHVFLHDPWNNVLWGGDYGGPSLPMNYTFFNEMWDYSGHWGLFVSPWNVKVETPSAVYVGQTFTVMATVFYVCPPQTPAYVYDASSCNATIILPEGLVLADGESATKSLGEIYAGSKVQTSWRVKAERPGNYSILVEAEGKITGFVGEKQDVGPGYQYEDRIGGYGSSVVNAEIASHIYIDAIKPAEGAPGTEAFIFGGGATPNGTVVALLSGPVNQTSVITVSQPTIQENVTIIVNMTLGWTAADAGGFWAIRFIVPDVSPGEYEIFVLDNSTQTSDVAKFHVLPPTPTQIKIDDVSPAEGYPNTPVFILGHGATPKGEVKIYFDQLNVASTVAYSDGGWLAIFNVPDVSPGNYTILALDVASNTSDKAVFRVLEVTPRNVGVKEGDWAKYNVLVNYSTNDPNAPIVPALADVDYLLIRIVSVAKTNVTYELVIRYKNGTEQESVSWLDVATGLTDYGIVMPYGLIIAANLTAGEKVYLNAYAPTINLTSTALYAGLQREVNSILMEGETTIPGYYRTFMDLEIRWDRISGILCEQKVNVTYADEAKGYETSMFAQIIITETNIWAKPSIANVKVSFCPPILNLKSKGKWVLCIVKLPEGYTAKDVNTSTIMLNGTIQGKVISCAGRSRYMIVKFDRKAVIEFISNETACNKKFGILTLTLTGEFKDGTTFSGTAKIVIIIPKNRHAEGHVACPPFEEPHIHDAPRYH